MTRKLKSWRLVEEYGPPGAAATEQGCAPARLARLAHFIGFVRGPPHDRLRQVRQAGNIEPEAAAGNALDHLVQKGDSAAEQA